MSRDVLYNEKAKCDRCGEKGAFDFMGDLLCPDCLTIDEDGNTMVIPDGAGGCIIVLEERPADCEAFYWTPVGCLWIDDEERLEPIAEEEV